MPAEWRDILLILATLTLDFKLISELISTMSIVFLLEAVALLHDTVVLLSLLLQGVLVVFDHAYDLLADSRRKSESQLVRKAMSALTRYSERIESELLIIVLMALLQGDGADGEGEGGLLETSLIAIHRQIVVNRHI